MIFVFSALFAFGLVGFIYKLWSGDVNRLETALKEEKRKQAELAQIKEQNQRYQAQKNRLESLYNTIQALEKSRVGPVEFLTALGNTVNRTNELYLLSVASQGDRTVIRGQANSVEAIATFIGALKSSGFFEDVQLRESYEDDQDHRMTFKFNLDCSYKPSSAAAPVPPPAPAPATPTRRAGM